MRHARIRGARRRAAWTAVIGTVGAVGAVAVVPLTAGTASAATSTVYVSPAGSAHGADHSCGTAAFQSVQAAVNAAPAYGTVIVCAGHYKESVTITRPLTLAGKSGATIDATGQTYGVGVAASGTTVSGLTVQDATVGGTLADGIVTAGMVNGAMHPANNVTITGNVVSGNAGSAIDLNSTSGSTAVGNRATGSTVGVNVSDDFGLPATGNRIINNVTSNNPGGCGIALADHTGKGISHTLVVGNVSDDNGLGSPSAASASSGSGVILAAPKVGGVFDNTIIGNEFSGNGHAGFDVHGHAPGLNFSGNVVTANRIRVNNLRTSEGDSATTGIYLGDASPMSILVIGNVISDNQVGIFTAGGPVTVNGAKENVFHHVATEMGTTPVFG